MRASVLLRAGSLSLSQLSLVAWACAVFDERHELFEPRSAAWEALAVRRSVRSAATCTADDPSFFDQDG